MIEPSGSSSIRRWVAAIDLRVLAVMGTYLAYVAVVTAVFAQLDHPPTVLGAALAVPAAAAVGYAVLWRVSRVHAVDDVERHIQLQSLAAGFLCTMLSALGYGLLEAFANLPRLSMWWVWGVGMGSWAVARWALQRAYR